MQNEKWKPVLEIIDPICKRLDFRYRVTYESEDGNRIGFQFWRAYDSFAESIIGLDAIPTLLLDWFSYKGEVRIKCASLLYVELADAIVDAFSKIRRVKTMDGDVVINPNTLSPEVLRLVSRLFQRDVNPIITLGILEELSARLPGIAPTATAPKIATQTGDTTQAATWHGNGEPPRTRTKRIAAVEAWDAIPQDERPKLQEWLAENFGTDHATDMPLVPESTFHGWRKLIPKS